jgi:hypothetical protein
MNGADIDTLKRVINSELLGFEKEKIERFTATLMEAFADVVQYEKDKAIRDNREKEVEDELEEDLYRACDYFGFSECIEMLAERIADKAFEDKKRCLTR